MPLDSLAQPSEPRKGQDLLLDQSGFSIERLPALGVICDQFAVSLAEQIAPFSRSSASFSVDTTETASLFEILAECRGLPAAVLRCATLDFRTLVIFDRRFVDSFVHLVFGGDTTECPDLPDRPYTKIDLGLIERFSKAVAPALEAAFTGFTEAPFAFEKQEPIADVYTLGRLDMPVITAHFHLDVPASDGQILLLLPQTALQPLRQKLSRETTNEAAPPDPHWTNQMRASISFAPIPVTGVLEELEMSLGEVAGFAVGDVLKLRGSGMGRVRVECGGRYLFWCKLDQTDGRYTLEIDEAIEQENDFLKEICAP